MSETFSTTDIAIKQLASSGGSVESVEPRGKGRIPSFWQVVIGPALFFGAVFGGGILSVCLVGIGQYSEDMLFLSGMRDAWLVVGGMVLGGGLYAVLFVGCLQLVNWNAQMVVRNKTTLNGRPKREPQRQMDFHQSPTNRRQWNRDNYSWANELPEMARIFYNQRGEWVAPDRLTRAQLTGVIKSLTESYPLVIQDLKAWGWIDDLHNWTDLGKTGLRAKYKPLPRRDSL